VTSHVNDDVEGHVNVLFEVSFALATYVNAPEGLPVAAAHETVMPELPLLTAVTFDGGKSL
jgi:hypothetical protein